MTNLNQTQFKQHQCVLEHYPIHDQRVRPAKENNITIINNNFNIDADDLMREVAQNLKDLINRSSGNCNTMPALPNLINNGAPVAANEKARVWGDPHFEGGDGDRYDVMGEAGKTYNLFNDTGVSINGKFDSYDNGKTTFVTESGLTFGQAPNASQLLVSSKPKGSITLNGTPIKAGESKTLPDGSKLTMAADGKSVSIKTPEGYDISAKIVKEGAKGELEIKVNSGANGVASDGRMPGGLLGETFDADKTARKGTGKQGEGAINLPVQSYEIQNGLFGAPSQAVAPNYNNNLFGAIQDWFNQNGLGQIGGLPGTSPITMQPINWMQELQNTLTKMCAPSAGQVNDAANENDRLFQMMMAAITSGNVNMAMMIFAHMETKSANQMSKTLMQKMQGMQKQKTDLINQLQNAPTGENGAKQMQVLNQQLGTVNDDLSMLQSFMKEVMQNKNQSIEFASNFTSNEHQTTMAVIRSMK